jgi:tetratricopeptide (TPR) repeat protein
MKPVITLALILGGALLCAPALAAQQQTTAGQDDGPMTENPRYNKPPSKPPKDQNQPVNSAPPRSDDESSSEQNRLNLSPPKGDLLAHPEGGGVAEEALGVHEWNPLRAMKDVEVGDYYYGRGSYKAAVSRYREALEFKPRDAVATFRLARTLEKMKAYDEARHRYEEYLAILKDGPEAGEARKALERLKTTTTGAKR